MGRGTAAVVVEVEPKCKAGNLIWWLAEGCVVSSPGSFARDEYADSRQLYIINSHKYANSATGRATRGGHRRETIRVRERKHGRAIAGPASVSHAALHLPLTTDKRNLYLFYGAIARGMNFLLAVSARRRVASIRSKGERVPFNFVNGLFIRSPGDPA